MSKLIQKSSSQSDMKTLNQRKKELANEGKDLKQLIAAKESECHSLQQRLYDEARHIPNLTSPSTPIGGESNAIVVEVVNSDLFEGTSKQSMRDHMAIAAMHDMVDFERAGKVTGSSFYYLRNAGTLLEMALTRFAMQRCMEAGFTPIMTPDVIRHEVVEACGFNPRSDDPQTYFLAEHGQTSSQDASASKRNPNQLCLSATAEFPLAAMYGNEILTLDKLPTKMVAMGKAFRAEGLAGATNRGLYRVHQFTKVEMFSITNKDGSDEALQEIAQIQKSLFQDLELCFRILDMPTHDLGAPAYKKFDMEAWMPGRQTWGEISSASNCTDYQSRRLNIRHFTGGSATEATDFVHTINGTACAVPRLIIALLETHQRENGDVYIPTKLRPYFLGPEVDVLKANQPFLRSFS
ncbi:hypothetical protein DFS34DRAFT_628482 [Phlyctochytrium arcticum]|nr:hypothetical protein DFS34DRAFT_628482 [Phlyctochytrium arcticum]